ncbi:phosphatidate cytidylyltransferase [bacterium]|nr:phosphatidate cytidylyltransferase [bacterium]
MVSRILIALFGIPLVYFILISGSLSRLIFFITAGFVGQYELFRIIDVNKPSKNYLVEYFLGISILLAANYGGERGLLLSLAFSQLVLACAELLRGVNGENWHRFSHGAMSLLYLQFCLAFFVILGNRLEGKVVFSIFVSIWAVDTGAYIIGSLLGGPKLAPKISPKKTISGAVGGGSLGILSVWMLNNMGIFQLSTKRMWGLAIGVSIISQISDLFESLLKREGHVKDSGAILAGHGGMLDRLDSILFIGPFSYLLLVK